jgi:hypothetical protein
MTTNHQQLTSQRRFGRSGRRQIEPPATVAPQSSVTLDRILAVPVIDRALGDLLNHPRILQVIGISIGIVMVILALRSLLLPSAPHPALVMQPAAPSSTAELAMPAPQHGSSAPVNQDILDVVAAYNQASITAAVLNRADVMAPYLAPDGKAWAEVQAEYERRATRGEAHDPAMTRWGVLRIAANGDTATVETQEEWDDVTSVAGQVVSSRRGILTHHIYELRRSPSMGRWLITNIRTTGVIG